MSRYNALDLLDSAEEDDLANRPSFEDRLSYLGVTRLFVAGLATDYIVKHTLYDALGNNWYTDRTEKPANIQTVVFLQGLSRGKYEVPAAA
jgi:hypothetical protein